MLLAVMLLSCASGEFVEDQARRRSNTLTAEAYGYWDADWAMVFELASRAIEVDPLNPRPYAARGRAYLATDQYGRAMTDLDASIKLSPDYPPPIIARAEVYMKLGELDMAREGFMAALELVPDSITALVHMAEIYSLEERPHTACLYMKKAIVMGFSNMAGVELNPDLQNMRSSDCYFDVIRFDAEGL